MSLIEIEEAHIGVVRPNAERHMAIHWQDESGLEYRISSLESAPEGSDGEPQTIGEALVYEDGKIIGQREVILPEVLAETGEHRSAKLHFTERQRQALGVGIGAAALTATIVVGSLVVIRRNHKK